MPIPRMSAWFGAGAYSYSGILHLPAPFPAIIERLREHAEALSGASKHGRGTDVVPATHVGAQTRLS